MQPVDKYFDELFVRLIHHHNLSNMTELAHMYGYTSHSALSNWKGRTINYNKLFYYSYNFFITEFNVTFCDKYKLNLHSLSKINHNYDKLYTDRLISEFLTIYNSELPANSPINSFNFEELTELIYVSSNTPPNSPIELDKDSFRAKMRSDYKYFTGIVQLYLPHREDYKRNYAEIGKYIEIAKVSASDHIHKYKPDITTTGELTAEFVKNVQAKLLTMMDYVDRSNLGESDKIILHSLADSIMYNDLRIEPRRER